MNNPTVTMPRELAELCEQCLSNSGYDRGRDTLRAILALPEDRDHACNADNASQALTLLDFALSFALCNLDHGGTRRDIKKAQAHLESYKKFMAEQHQGEPELYVERRDLDRIAKGHASWATAWKTDGKDNPSRPGDCVPFYTHPAEHPAPAPVVLPSRDDSLGTAERDDYANGYRHGWNACLDEVARLNPPQQ